MQFSPAEQRRVQQEMTDYFDEVLTDYFDEVMTSKYERSKPSPPYYYKISGSDTFHWHRDCHLNFYDTKRGWVSSDELPSGREQCDSCRNM